MVEVNRAEVALRECDGVIDRPGEIFLGKGARRLRDEMTRSLRVDRPLINWDWGAIGANHAVA